MRNYRHSCPKCGAQFGSYEECQVNVAYPGVPPANPLTPGGVPLPYPLTVVGAPPLPPTQSGAPTYPHTQVQTRAPPPNAQFGAPRLPIIQQNTSRNQTEQVQPSAPEVIPYPQTQSGTPSYTQTSITGVLPHPVDPELPTYEQTQLGAPSLHSLQQDTSRNQSIKYSDLM